MMKIKKMIHLPTCDKLVRSDSEIKKTIMCENNTMGACITKGFHVMMVYLVIQSVMISSSVNNNVTFFIETELHSAHCIQNRSLLLNLVTNLLEHKETCI